MNLTYKIIRYVISIVFGGYSLYCSGMWMFGKWRVLFKSDRGAPICNPGNEFYLTESKFDPAFSKAAFANYAGTKFIFAAEWNLNPKDLVKLNKDIINQKPVSIDGKKYFIQRQGVFEHVIQAVMVVPENLSASYWIAFVRFTSSEEDAIRLLVTFIETQCGVKRHSLNNNIGPSAIKN